jgi:hypothetical protein
MQMINIDTVAVPSTSTYSKIAEYPNIEVANPLICCKIAEYPNIRSANPLICSKIAQYPISESIILYLDGAAKAQNIPNYRYCSSTKYHAKYLYL